MELPKLTPLVLVARSRGGEDSVQITGSSQGNPPRNTIEKKDVSFEHWRAMYLLSEDSEPPAPVTFLDRKPKRSLQLIIFGDHPMLAKIKAENGERASVCW